MNVDLSPFLVSGKDASHISGLQPDFAAALYQLLSAAPGGGVQITSGYRTPERQAQLWAEAVAKYGSEAEARRWVAPPGRSNHNHGAAVDLNYASPDVERWVHENAPRFGLNFRMGHEPWHIEMAANGQPVAVPNTPNAPGGNLPFNMGTPGSLPPAGMAALGPALGAQNPLASVLSGYQTAPKARLGDLVSSVQAEQDAALQRAKAPQMLSLIDQLSFG